ncbi:MAG: hydroxymethylpyrimidine/phosphomethylpyrimidine kinase [Leptonema sp. (in: bacteria)]
MKKPICLSIAGVDNLGFSGIYNDLRTFYSLDCYGVTVITAIASQNNQGVRSIHPIPIKIIEDQIYTILNSFNINATKIGMVYKRQAIQIIENYLKNFMWIVLDPILQSTSGNFLIEKHSLFKLYDLFPKVNLVTPNIPEILYILNQKQEKDKYEIEELKEKCVKFFETFKTPVLLKGGHNQSKKIVFDIFYDGVSFSIFRHPIFTKKNIRGTGCSLSSAITSYLAKGNDLLKSIRKSEKYLQNLIKNSKDYDLYTKILWH